jgi:peroxiredoxin
MVELGELEKQHEEFAKRNVRLVVISNDDQQDAQLTQKKFPHLTVVADTDQKMAKVLQVLDPGHGPKLTDTNAPTTFLVDGSGTVRWMFRPDVFFVRLSPEELLKAIDEHKVRSTS